MTVSARMAAVEADLQVRLARAGSKAVRYFRLFVSLAVKGTGRVETNGHGLLVSAQCGAQRGIDQRHRFARPRFGLRRVPRAPKYVESADRIEERQIADPLLER